MIDANGKEMFLIKTVGGPHPGIRNATEDERYAGFEVKWPLPQVLPDAGGKYVKTNESQLPTMIDNQFMARGAQYEWEADEAV